MTYPPVPKASTGPAIERLFWRAGFGPSPADRTKWNRRGLDAAIDALVAPTGKQLAGRQLRYRADSKRLLPITVGGKGDDAWAQEVLWWLDRMVRTRAPLVERMTLNLHDHFATSNHKVNDAKAMVAQNELIRRNALGSFETLCRELTRDPAMQTWLDLANSDPEHPNENYAREFMELFTIGTEHTQKDVEEMARAFTGFRFDWDSKRFWYDPEQHDDGVKTILGKTGRFDADGAIRVCLEHPAHAPFLCRKVWSYFVPTEPSAKRLRVLTRNYVGSGWNLGVLVKTILRSPELYTHLTEPDMVKPPVVHLVGTLRALKAPYLLGSFRWQLDQMGQMPFYPPHVGGWDQGEGFLSTGTAKARFEAMGSALELRPIKDGSVAVDETPTKALDRARAQVGRPWESGATRSQLTRLSRKYVAQWNEDTHFATERRLVLRHLLVAGPDACMH